MFLNLRPILLLLALLLGVAWADPGSLSERKVVLERLSNARDVGGVLTPAGRIKRHILFRSSALYAASAKDIVTLKALKIHTVIDFRGPTEAADEGKDPSLGRDCHGLALPIGYSWGGERWYRTMMEPSNSASWRGYFTALADPNRYPILYHCAKGKDRTGVATALLFEFLGVPRQTITEDYLESLKAGPSYEVKGVWLAAVFRDVDRAGGIAPYLKRQGVDEPTLQSIRSILLDRPAKSQKI